MIFSKHKLGCAVLVAALVWMLPSPEVSASGGAWGGSFGSGGGSFGGGSWGSSGGGLLGGRRPVRNLLSRIGDRLGNIGGGSWGSSGGGGGSFGGSSGGSFGNGGFLRGGLLCNAWTNRGGGSWGGSSGSVAQGSGGGSFGGYSLADNFISTNDFAYPSDFAAPMVSNIAPYSAPMAGSNFTMEQSYPVGDQGLVPGLPVYNSYMGGNVIGGQTINGAFDGGFTPVPAAMPTSGRTALPGDASAIQDGGSINDMLEGNTLPMDNNGGYYPEKDASGSGLGIPSPGPRSDDSTFFQNLNRMDRVAADEAILRLNVPEEAKVYVNGRLTKTPGAIRSYESKGLTADRAYHFKIKAVIERDGKQLVRSKLVSLQAGQVKDTLLDFDAPATTVLALNVPENATVKLCGAETKLQGKNRRFTTTRLTDGEVCEDYTIEVSYDVDGRTVNRVKKIDLAAGDLATLSFGNEAQTSDQIAAR
jgi:uncharacterized protein (TIGR03000 family)